MAIAVVLFPASGDEPRLQPEGLERLADLGITSVALVRDEATAGLVLEGWAFEPTRAKEAALALIGTQEGVRTLGPLAEMAVGRRS